MKRFAVLWALVWAALLSPLGGISHAQSYKVPVILSGQQDPCPGASLCARFTGQAGYKAGGVITSNFSALPGLTVTANSFRYGENADGSLIGFQANQPRLTTKGLGVFEARTNLVLWSEAFSNVAWTKTAASVSGSVVAPNGAATATTLTATATTSGHEVSQAITLATATTEAFSAYAQPGTKGFAFLSYQSGTAGHYVTAVYNLGACGSVATQTAVGGTSGTITSTSSTIGPNGWCRLILVGQIAQANGNLVIGIAPQATGNSLTSVGEITYAASASDSISIWGAEAE